LDGADEHQPRGTEQEADPAPGWEALWPPRRDAVPHGRRPVVHQATDADDVNGVDARADGELARVSALVETVHADLAGRTASDYEAVRASMRSGLAELEDRLLSSVGDRLREIEAHHARVVRELWADVEGLRAELAAAIAQQLEARADAWERDVTRAQAVETRLRSELQDILASGLAALGGSEHAPLALSERLDRVTDEVAQLRSQLVAADAKLDDRLAEDLASARAEVDAGLSELDAVVDAVDDDAARPDARLAQLEPGAADVEATTGPAPVGSDLRSVHDEVAATQRSISELRRRMRTLLGAPAPDAPGLPPSGRATSRNPPTA